MGLRRSRDRKVTNSVTDTGNARGFNSFGLPSGKAFSCPGATGFCEKICYAGKLERLRPAISNLLMGNWDLLKDASQDEMYSLIHEMISEFVTETDRTNAKGNKASYDFRIHWDGDFFSSDYAAAWARVIKDFPGVRFWVYTRSFTEELNVIPNFWEHGEGRILENLNLYLSADPDNIELANEVAGWWNGVNIATVADTFEEAKATIIDNSRKTYNCPEVGGRIPLISTKGSACISCGICPSGRGDVAFSVSGK